MQRILFSVSFPLWTGSSEIFKTSQRLIKRPIEIELIKRSADNGKNYQMKISLTQNSDPLKTKNGRKVLKFPHF